MVVGRGLRLVLTGIVIGTAGALAVTRLLASLLYEVGPRDLASFAAVALLFVAVAAVASYIPARRAALTDPIRVLRED